MKINKWMIVGGIIGGLCALIPAILTINHLLIYGTAGDPGPFWPYMFIPLFWPAGITAFFFGIILLFIYLPLKNNQILIYTLIGAMNTILWIFVGGFIGKVIKKRKKK